MHILALDIGRRRTGVAFAECPPGVPLMLPTIHHTSACSLLEQVTTLVHARRIDHIVVGLPLLSSGKEGMQARHVRALLPSLAFPGVHVSTLDERYSTPQRTISNDPDAEAAWNILTVFIARFAASGR